MNAKIVTAMARPGTRSCHGSEYNARSKAWRSMLPQLAVGGRGPKPRYASPASATSTPAMPKVAAIRSGERTLGMIRWPRMRLVRLPAAIDASTKGSSRIARVEPRTRRMNPKTNTIESERITFSTPGPRMPATAIASTSGGKLRPPSTIRIRTLSVLPPT